MNQPFIIAFLGLLLTLASPSSGQDRTNREELRRIADSYRSAVVRGDAASLPAGRASKRADSSGLSLQILGLRGGRPLIYTTHNLRAAASVRTTSLLGGGRSGLNLSGEGRHIGLWDAGNVLPTHRELEGRVAQRDTTSEGETHATHVAGTLAATGLWDVVRGMAPKSRVDSYNWVDDVIEMAEGAAEGLTLSNHSYGVPLGWSPDFQDGLWAWMGDPAVSSRVDFRFGRYGDMAAEWDQIAVAAPYYLIVKSAGNERERQGPRDGEPHYVFDEGWEISTEIREADAGITGYDTIGDAGLSKNVLTVGASESAPWGVETAEDVVMTNFSGWGPTDDGRIKPDIVAPGVMLMSAKAGSDEDYGPSSGTSMAAPVVAGSAALLQELFEREFGDAPPLSSTIKALIVHTADEAGPSDGPDYQFGWGQLNSERAALHLRQAGIASRSAAPIAPYPAQIIEASLAAGDHRDWVVTVTEEEPFRATLAWIDPAATPGEPRLDDPEAKLVHDLDLVVTGPDGEHHAWTLDPFRPAAPAEKGLNVLDNIEQVFFEAEPGQYTVRVNMPTTLTTEMQTFSLLIGEARDVFEGPLTSSISGTLKMGDAGIHDVVVHARGPVWTNFKTLKDGVFFFDQLPPGTYTLFPEDPLLSFSPSSMEVTLPGGANKLEFEAIPPVEFVSFDLLESPRLLHSGEVEAGRKITTAAAGGVYGLSFVFSSSRTQDMEGLKLFLDTEYDPRVVPYSGATGNRMLELSEDWPLAAFDANHLSKRVPAIWFDGSVGAPYEARIPYSIRLDTDQILFADTLAIAVDRPDDMAPIPHASVRLPGLTYAPPGTGMEVSVGYLDGSPIQSITALMLDRYHESTILHSIPLRDSGNRDRDIDIVKGDGLYSARFTPQAEAEYRLAIHSVDVHGNENTVVSDLYYSSVPFTADQDILFWTSYDQGSRTRIHQEVFDQIGFGYDWWDELTRGQISDADLSSFDLVVLARHSAPIRTDADRAQISAFVRDGGSMLLLGQNPAGATSADWFLSEFGVRFQERTSNSRTVLGANSLQGLEAVLSEAADPFSILAPPDAVPLLTIGGEVVAIQMGRLVLSTLSAASFDLDTQRQDLLSGLMYLASSRSDVLPTPRPPAFDQAADFTMTGNLVDLSWTHQPFASYAVQVATSPTFDALLADTTALSNSISLGPFGAGARLFARVKGINAAGQSAWSPALAFHTLPPNAPPVALAGGSTFYFYSTEVGPSFATVSDLTSLFSDPEGESLRFEASTPDAGLFELLIENNDLVFRPLAEGVAIVTLKAFDPGNEWAAITYTLVNTPRAFGNEPPVLSGGLVTSSRAILGDVLVRDLAGAFSDPNGDPLSFEVQVVSVSGLQAVLADGVLTLTCLATGENGYNVVVKDGKGGLATFHEAVVIAENQPPTLVAPLPDVNLLVGTRFSMNLPSLWQDPEGESLNYTLSLDPEGPVDIRNDSLFAFFERPGLFSVTLTATDPRQSSSSASFQFNVDAEAAVTAIGSDVPTEFGITSVFPMPFSDRTTFVVDIPDAGPFLLTVFSADGRRVALVADRSLEAGTYHLGWSAHNLPSGVYFYRATWSGQSTSGTLIKTK